MRNGDPAGSRTQNTRLKRPVLCQLSYRVSKNRQAPGVRRKATGGLYFPESIESKRNRSAER